jgi:hypothetical protein
MSATGAYRSPIFNGLMAALLTIETPKSAQI